MGVRRTFVAIAWLAWCAVAPLWAAPPEPSATPTPVGHPAPVWRFDGEDYYLIDRSARPGERVLAFLRDGESPETCSRRLWLRKVACKNLRAYELAYTRNWDQSQRDVTYRSDFKLVHSGWVQHNGLVEWRLMHWELQAGALVCAEYELFARPPSSDVKILSGLVQRQSPAWRKQLATMMKQAASLLNVP